MFPEGRFFDFAIVAVLALIIIGPKDLPVVMRKVGQFIARMRGMAAEFRASFDEMARQSELDELRKEVEALRNLRPSAMAANAMGLGDLHADVSQTIGDIHSDLSLSGAAPHAAADESHPEGEASAPESAPVMRPLAADEPAKDNAGAEDHHPDRPA